MRSEYFGIAFIVGIGDVNTYVLRD